MCRTSEATAASPAWPPTTCRGSAGAAPAAPSWRALTWGTGNWAVLALPSLSFLLELTLSLRKQDRNCHIWASGGNSQQAASLAGQDGTVWGALKMLEERGWCSCLVHPGRLLGLERVNPTPCGLCSCQPGSCCWDIWQGLLGQLCSGPAHKGVNCAELSAPSPSPSSAAHPVFRFQATYLSNLRGVTPRPAGSFRPQLSFPPALQRGEASWLGVDPLSWLPLGGVSLGCPSGTALTHSSITGLEMLCAGKP